MVIEPYRNIADCCSRIFVVGDLHGCSRELAVLLEHLERYEKVTSDDYLIFVGDYIDRGDDSRGVISQLIELAERHERTVFLKGNHEDMLLAYLGFPGRWSAGFLRNGGVQTLASYGLLEVLESSEVRVRFPEEHLEFVHKLDRYVVTDKFVIVHAGLNPLRDIENQADEDLFWIRDEFIANIHYFEKTVVFGHSPHREVFVDWPYKLGVDTGLVYGNKLTCLELNEKRLIQVRPGRSKVISRKLRGI